MLSLGGPGRSFIGALAASLLLHGMLFVVAEQILRRASANHSRSPPPPLSATLLAPPPSGAPQAAVPPLLLPRPAAASTPLPRAAVRSAPTPPAPAASTVSLVRQAQSQLAEHLYYPLEAVERGLEGEVLLLVFIDAGGAVVAARVERGSGHALLDDAAVAAARRLRALPAAVSATEFLLPVRFRLN